MNKKLSIIIVSYNSENDLFSCIESIYECNDIGLGLEVIVVDNDSFNKTYIYEVKEKYSDIIIIENKNNLGYGQGNNIGIKKSSSEIILIINPDVRLLNFSFLKLIDSFFYDSKLAVTGFKQMENILHSGVSFLPLFFTLKNIILHKYYIKKDEYKSFYFCFSGACFAFRKSVFYSINFFSNQIFLYGEERYLHMFLLKNKDLFRTIYLNKFSYIHPMHSRKKQIKQFELSLKSYFFTLETYGYNSQKYKKKYIKLLRLFYIRSLITNNSSDKEYYRKALDVLKNTNSLFVKRLK